LALDDRNSAAQLEKMGKINTDEPYHTRGLATSRHDTPHARFELTANATSTTPTQTQTCPTANADVTGDFIFILVLPSPNKRGRRGVGARSSSSKNPQLPKQQ
jgi:hypothetical protein